MLFVTIVGLLLREFEAFFVAAFRVVADEFEEERDLVGFALGADAFDEGVFDVVDLRVVEGRVIDEDFHGVRAHVFFDALDGDVRQEVGQAAGLGVIVTAVFVGEQEARVFRARFRGGQTPLGVEKNGACMRSQDARDGGLELLHHFVCDVLLRDTFCGGERLGQTSTLIHCGGRDDARLCWIPRSCVSACLEINSREICSLLQGYLTPDFASRR